jgi:two-component system nitrate/nitrite response regulator NarL
LDAEHDLTVLGVTYDTYVAIALSRTRQPDVLLLDAKLAGDRPAPTLSAVRSVAPAAKVLLVTGDDGRQTNAAMGAAGADGVVTKHFSSRHLVDAIRAAIAGQQPMVLGAAVREQWPMTPAPTSDRPGHDGSVERLVGTLSSREWEVLTLLADGWSTRRIADNRHLTRATVASYIQNLLTKLGVHSRLEAAAFALHHEVVTAGRAGVRARHGAY